MSNLRILIDIMGAFLETIIIYYYMKAAFKDCKVNKCTEMVTYFIMMIFISVTSISYPNTIVLPIVLFIFLMFLSMFYRGRILLKLTLNLILAAFFISSEVVAIAILVGLTGENAQFILSNRVYYLQRVFVSKL